MAIAPDILVAVLIDDEQEKPVIHLANMNKRFAKREIEIDTNNPKEPVSIDSKTLGNPLSPVLVSHSFGTVNVRMEQLLQSRIPRTPPILFPSNHLVQGHENPY